MKPCFEKHPSPDVLNCASSSGQSRDDQETGSNAVSMSEDVPLRNSVFLCFPPDMNLNPARKVVAEMVGTFILMFCVCGIMASTVLMRGEVALLEYSATAGLTIIVVIFSIGPISGAHVNPAITIAFATVGHFPFSKTCIAVQAKLTYSSVREKGHYSSPCTSLEKAIELEDMGREGKAFLLWAN